MGRLSPADPVAIAVQVAAVLEGLGVRYVLGGSLASTAFGEPRATLDVDLAADLGAGQAAAFVAAVAADFFVDAQWVAAEIDRRGSFQLVHRASMIRVDVFVPAWEGFHRWKWEHRRRIELGGGVALDITSPEAIVVQKLVWYRAGGETSERQWRDVLGVLKGQRGHLDLEAVREQADATGVADLFARACADAGLA
jgi:hypothetical protein